MNQDCTTPLLAVSEQADGSTWDQPHREHGCASPAG